jgi:hypothetical protein
MKFLDFFATLKDMELSRAEKDLIFRRFEAKKRQ